MYLGQTDLFLNQYEEGAKRPFGYLLIDLKTTTQDNCRLRTNVLSSGEGFNQACFQENIPQELVKYIKRKIFRLSCFFQLFKRYTATWMTCFLETLKIFGMMKKLSDTFSCKTGTSFKEQLNTSLRWLDWIFLGGYLPSLSLKYVGMSKDMEKRLSQLYYIKMKISYDLGFIAIGVAMAT